MKAAPEVRGRFFLGDLRSHVLTLSLFFVPL